MYSEKDKHELFDNVVRMVCYDPTVVEVFTSAIQHGITTRLKKEIHINSDLATGIATMVQTQKSCVRKQLHYMQPSLQAALQHYKGAPVAEKIKELIDEYERGKSDG